MRYTRMCKKCKKTFNTNYKKGKVCAFCDKHYPSRKDRLEKTGGFNGKI